MRAFPSRCPTGYLTTTTVFVTPLLESCDCTVTGTVASCSCSPTASCSCTIPSSCSCDVADTDFEDKLLAELVVLQNGCMCFSIPDIEGTNVPFYGNYINGNVNASLLSLIVTGCPNITSVQGVDPRFQVNVSLAFQTLCSLGSMEILVGAAPNAYPFYSVSSPATLNGTALFSPGGVPLGSVMTLVYSASSTLPGSSPYNAAAFAALSWRFVPPRSEW